MKMANFLPMITFFSFFFFAESGSNKGEWELLKSSAGISAMHMALLPNDKIIAFDRTDFGPSNITFPNGKCRVDPRDQALKKDCYVHSVEFDLRTRSIRPLTILTDTWCSSGALSPDGKLVQTGGFNDGDRTVRYFSPCATCDWVEVRNGLIMRRWYASNQILPSGKIIVVGGRRQYNYEFIPKTDDSDNSLYELPFLEETRDNPTENNLYPFTHLSTDGNLFIFTNTKAILLDYVSHRVVRTFPAMPGGVSRNYPSTGSSVLLPLQLNSRERNDNVVAEVMICGGAPSDSNPKAGKGIFVSASKTCGRLEITADSPEWKMEEMPLNRVMGDMILLPTGDVLIINGAAKGAAGWGVSREPVLSPVLYKTYMPLGGNSEFKVLSSTTIPRLYHSSAHLLPDGRVLVGGSNPNARYNFSSVLFPTELSLEAFAPPYLVSSENQAVDRPIITSIEPGSDFVYKQGFTIWVEGRESKGEAESYDEEFYVTMVAPSFTTHSFSMNQRLLVLEMEGVRQISGKGYGVDVFAPQTAKLAPPGYYLLFVVHGGVPSRGNWVHIK